MSLACRRSLALAVLLVVALASGTTEAARQSRPQLPGQKAWVAQGGKVDLAASRFTMAELAKLRPGYEQLKPRARTNAE